MVKTQRSAWVYALILSLFLVSCAAPATAPTNSVVQSDSAAATPALPSATVIQAASSATSEAPAPTAEDKSPTADDPTRPARVLLEARALQVGGATPTEIDIVLYDVQDLYGAEVHLTYDPAVLQVEDADAAMPGVQFTPGPDFKPGGSFTALNRVNLQKGSIDFAATLLNPAQPLQGKVVLATFSVRAIKAGSTQISFSQALLADRQGQPLALASQGGLKLDAQP